MPLDDVLQDYLGLVAERRPANGGLTALFCDDHAILSGRTKVMFDREDADQGLAPLVHWRLDGVPIVEPGDSLIEIEPAYSQIDRAINPERLMQRMPGEDPFSPASAPERREMYIVSEMLRRENRRVRLVEKMTADMLTTGIISLASPRYPTRTLDFGRASSLMIALGGAARWSEDSIDPLANMEDWSERVTDESGEAATTVIMGKDAWKAFAANPKVREILDLRRGTGTTLDIDPRAQTGALRARGQFGDFDIWTSSETYDDAAGIKRRFFPENGVSITSPEAVMAKVAYGAIIHTETMNEPVAGEMFHHTYTSQDGKFENLYSATAPIVFPMRPNATFFATVV